MRSRREHPTMPVSPASSPVQGAGKPVRIIVGLGNPGRKYDGNRHNVGFRCIDLLAKRLDIPVSDRRAKAVLGQGNHGEHKVVLAKPRTFMNHSGDAVQYLLARFGGGPRDLIVVYDEMALPTGRIRVRRGGSDAGHNGMTSIIQAVHTTDIPRVRIGIGKPLQSGADVAHVLGAFSADEKPLIEAASTRAADALVYLLENDIEGTMNLFNRADEQ